MSKDSDESFDERIGDGNFLIRDCQMNHSSSKTLMFCYSYLNRNEFHYLSVGY